MNTTRRRAWCIVVGLAWAWGGTARAIDPQPLPELPELPAPLRDEPPLAEIRDQSVRKVMLVDEGGRASTEAGVGHGLKWLAEHQCADGSWSFNHGENNKHVGPVNNAGTEKSTTGATAVALLPLLGCGQTHKTGKYRVTAQQGLNYLTGQIEKAGTVDERDLQSHALATMALCEGYAMTQDEALWEPAKKALALLLAAQDRETGGWRTAAGQPTNTAVTTWQVMALHSARLAGIEVPQKSLSGAAKFLSRVQKASGARYGLSEPGEDPTMTAAGLLCRIDLGWNEKQPALGEGVEFLSRKLPSKDLHFNFYTRHVMFRVGGAAWKTSNDSMRDALVNSQRQEGTHTAEKGSWYTAKPAHGIDGGRLYETALSCLMLEVYYTYAPLDLSRIKAPEKAN